MIKSRRGKVVPGLRRGLLPLASRLTAVQSSARSEKIARRSEEREAARLLERAKGRRRKKKES